jgi:hypothetical protein
MTLSNMELVRLVTEAYDKGFLRGFSHSDYGGYPEEEQAVLTSGDYIGERDDWIRARVPEGTTA